MSLSRRRRVLSAAAVAVAAFSAQAVFAKNFALNTGSAGFVPAESTVMTNVPVQFNGMDVNSFLGAGRFYSAGITGQNSIVANVEAGHVWSGHETLGHVTNFVTGTEAAGETDRHATWVGAMIGGRGTQAYQTGIAPGTDLRSGAIATSWVGNAYSGSFNASDASFVTTYAAFFGTADVINSSWGFGDAAGSSSWTLMMDGLARANPRTTFVVSAGNSGPANNSVGGPGSGHNSITVGALGSANNYTSIASFSSRGPQLYYDPTNGTYYGGRATVDIVAPGQNLTAAYYGGQTGGNGASLPGSVATGAPDWYTYSVQGTSFAAPIVAGGVALLESASREFALVDDARDARVIKAVLLNSADKLPGWNNGQALNETGVLVTSQSLDWTLGAGRMNLDRAYDQYLAGTKDLSGLSGGSIEKIGWDYGALTGGGTYNDYVFTESYDAGTPLDVTLSWFRNRSTDVQAMTSSDLGYADLDLEVWDSTFTTLIATSYSGVNDVEHLHFALPYTGMFGLRVLNYGQVFGDSVTEYYGLAWAVVPLPSAVLLGFIPMVVYAMRRRRGGKS